MTGNIEKYVVKSCIPSFCLFFYDVYGSASSVENRKDVFCVVVVL